MMTDTAIPAKQDAAGKKDILPSYVLITPARNEAEFIELTLKSVIAQRVKPLRWVIVSDGSTDGTDDIVKKYLSDHPWIELLRMPDRKERHFAGKVNAFNAGYEKIRGLQYDILGSLDADISFDKDYFSFLLEKFNERPLLGVGGSPFRQGTAQYDYRFSRKEHVSGACQLFRRECFESPGGYIPLKAGAIDLTAVVMARMKGWKTETFTETYCVHHRIMGTAKQSVLVATFKSGYGDFMMDDHPVWQLFRSIYQMTRKPLIIGGTFLLSGYIWAVLSRAQKPVPRNFIEFRRQEQMRWLRVLKNVRVNRNRVLRLMRENRLLSPHRVRKGEALTHDGTITTDAPNLMWGTDGTRINTVDEGWVWMFSAVEHWNAECVGWHLTKSGDRYAALEPIAQGLHSIYGSVNTGVARGLALRMDNGTQYLSDHFRNQIRFWGITPSYAFVEQPQTNGVVERFNRTLKEQVVYGRTYRNIEELRVAIATFIHNYNHHWRPEKNEFRAPCEIRKVWSLNQLKAAA